MVSGSRGANRLKKLTKQVPNPTITAALLLALDLGGKEEADRTIGIMGAAFVENAVKVAIHAQLAPLDAQMEKDVFDQSGPLYTFSAKIIMGQGLGLFGPHTRKDLDIIRNIRNTFAHTLETINFSHPDVASECGKLYHTGKTSLALELRGAKAKFVRTVINVSTGLRDNMKLRMQPFHKFYPPSLP